MATRPYAVIELDGPDAGKVIDVIEADQDEGSPNREILVDTGTHRFIESKRARIGWTWTEEGGLKAG